MAYAVSGIWRHVTNFFGGDMGKKNVVCKSAILGREMHVVVHGEKGLPIVVFPTMGMAPESLEEVGMVDELADYVDSGVVQLFCTETIDAESWGSDADNEERAQRQETYYHFVVDELVPLVHKVNGTDARPLALGCDTGATQASIVALRRPDLFQGCVCLSGCYDARRYFGDWMDATLYDNTPCAFLPNMDADHPYVPVYNQRQLLFCTGQDASEADSLRSTRVMGEQLARLGVDVWCDYWGGDVTHTWYWWKKQLRYFMPIVLDDVEKTTAAEKPAKRRATRKPAARKTAAKTTTAKKPAAAKATAAKAPAAAATKAAEKPAAKKPAATKAAPKAAAKPATTAAAKKAAEPKPAAKKAEPAKKPAAPAAAPIAKAAKAAAPAKAVKAEVPAKAVKAEVPAKAVKPAAPAKVEPKPAAVKKPAATKAAPAAKKPAAKATTTKTAAAKKPAAAKTAAAKTAAKAAPATKKPAATKAAAKPAAKKGTSAK